MDKEVAHSFAVDSVFNELFKYDCDYLLAVVECQGPLWETGAAAPGVERQE
jgi:hypothetical protein